jgi:hypothetical protein
MEDTILQLEIVTILSSMGIMLHLLVNIPGRNLPYLQTITIMETHGMIFIITPNL